MTANQSPTPEGHSAAPRWHHDVTPNNLDSPPVDSETAALFRASLYPVISQSPSWDALADRLRIKGYGLTMRDGRLFLTSQHTGTRVCSFRFLGMPLSDMVARLGRPISLAMSGQNSTSPRPDPEPQ